MANATADGRIQCNVAVIGAGMAGLVAVRELVREGHQVTAIELGTGPGGTWRYTPATDSDLLGLNSARGRIHSSMYKNLRTNQPREIMSFLDFPFIPEAMGGRSKDPRRFCSHEEVLSYLDAYTERFQLQQYVQYNTLVSKMDYLWPNQPQQQASSSSSSAVDSSTSSSSSSSSIPGPRWRLTLERTEGEAYSAEPSGCTTETSQDFDAVVVCNGHFFEPNIPEVAGLGTFPGTVMHSHNYRSPEAYAGQVVLVVGAAYSGEDICRDVAQVADAVYLSGRSFTSPIWTSGEPSFGPRRNIWTRGLATTLHSDGAADFAWGDSVPRVDTVLFATGYKYTYPFLEHTGLLKTDRQHVEPLYQHLLVPECGPRLSFPGLPFRVAPFPLCQVQSRYIARLLSGRTSLPSVQDMHADIKAFHQRLEAAGVAPEHTHRMAGDVQWEYLNWLIEASGPDLSPMPAWRVDMYLNNGLNKRAHPEDYRDNWVDQVSAEAAQGALQLMWQELEEHDEQLRKRNGLIGAGESPAKVAAASS